MEKKMNHTLSRKKNMERVASPEQIDEYIRVSNPSAWVVIFAFAILLVGICVWGIFGRLDTTVSVVAVNKNGGIVCYVKESDRAKIKNGMAVKINGEEFLITEIETAPVLVGASVGEYEKHVGGLNDGEWIYYIHTDCKIGVEGEVFPAEIIIERVNPLYFVTN